MVGQLASHGGLVSTALAIFFAALEIQKPPADLIRGQLQNLVGVTVDRLGDRVRYFRARGERFFFVVESTWTKADSWRPRNSLAATINARAMLVGNSLKALKPA